MNENENVLTSYAYISRSESVEGCWLAQIFEYGVITFGSSPQDALEMVYDAWSIQLVDDIKDGLDIRGRRCPEEEWAPLKRLFEKHTRVRIKGMNEAASEFKEFAVPVSMKLIPAATCVDEDSNPPPSNASESMAA